MKKVYMKFAAIVLGAALVLSTPGMPALATPQTALPMFYDISSPYSNVDWSSFGQYKAAHHTHTTYSDGSNTREDMLKDKYAKNFDIVAITDHDVLTTAWNEAPQPATGNWNNIGTAVLSSADTAAINAGTYDFSNPSPGTYHGDRTNGNGMISMGGSNEVSASDDPFRGGGANFCGHHINAFFAEFTSASIPVGQRTIDNILAKVAELGGVTHLNHLGRYTGGQNNAARSSDPEIVAEYVRLFMAHESCIGMEIINQWDGESVNDRILWDNILMMTMPHGRPVWGFSNDDSHSLSRSGHAWNVMLMPALTERETRISMETGAFYGVSRVDRTHHINSAGVPRRGSAQTGTTAEMHGGGPHNLLALSFFSQTPPPAISGIAVSGNTIAITGADYIYINWIADGEVVARGDSIDVSHYAGINSYVRAELVGLTGVAYTQPFGVSKAAVLNAAPSASVRVIPGNTNYLTVTIVETYSNGMTNIIKSDEMAIRNNAEGIYEVAGYKVYVDTKGDNQICACHIVET
ncbi:MAG: hypothetical protein FWC40_07065 [Proteobacteria bacterium]|nr:hypothetical protein [Pseudomonadota bacterium]